MDHGHRDRAAQARPAAAGPELRERLVDLLAEGRDDDRFRFEVGLPQALDVGYRFSVAANMAGNVLVYAHDLAAGEKHLRAVALVQGLWETRTGVVSTQVLQELYVNLRRKVRVPLSAVEVRRLVAEFLGWQVVVNDGRAVVEAAELEERFRISYWDALIIHAAAASGAETLYSEDLTHGRRYGTVRVVNPFLALSRGVLACKGVRTLRRLLGVASVGDFPGPFGQPRGRPKRSNGWWPIRRPR